MNRLRFLHIPKTAGSTLNSILYHQYQAKGSFAFTGQHPLDVKRFQALPNDDRSNLELFTGHAPILTGIEEADSAAIITLLRDPVNRVKSFCQHVSEGKSPYLRKNFPPESFNLDRFLESGNRELNNLQTKMLINKGRCASPLLIDRMSAIEARDTALENLFNKITVFGLQEYFDESVAIFSSTLNWNIPTYSSNNMKSSTNIINFSQHHTELIKELNAIDISVYNIAREKFKVIVTSGF